MDCSCIKLVDFFDSVRATLTYMPANNTNTSDGWYLDRHDDQDPPPSMTVEPL